MWAMDRISLFSRIVAVPICIIFLIRYFFATKEVKRYKAENLGVVSPVTSIKKSVVLIVLAACIVSVPVVKKIDDVCWNHYKTSLGSASSGKSSSSNGYSNLVEKHEDTDFLCFKMDIEEYINKYNENLSDESDKYTLKLQQLSMSEATLISGTFYGGPELTSYKFDDKVTQAVAIARNNSRLESAIAVNCYSDNKDVCEIRSLITEELFNHLSNNNKLSSWIEDTYKAFIVIDPSLTVDKLEKILSQIEDGGGCYYNNGILYQYYEDTNNNFIFAMTAMTEEFYNEKSKGTEQ